jgi:Sec-independent protein translocase protein TatA
LPLQSKGKHTLKVVAYDFAQNHTESSTTFFSSDISAPKIKVEDKQINRGDSIVISGTSDYPNTDVNIYLNIDTKDDKIYTVKSDSDGAFKIKTDKINKGDSVSINARVAISKDVLGAMSDTLTVYISDTSVVNTSKSIIYIMSFVVPALFMIIVAILMVYAGWYRFFGLRRRIKSEIKAVQTSVHKVMNEFRKELAEQLEYLQEKKEDRTITKKEEKIIAELKKNIDRVEEVIEKKIGEIK